MADESVNLVLSKNLSNPFRDFQNKYDESSRGRSPVPVIVVTRFIPRERMPLWMVSALPATIFNSRAFLPGSEAQICSMTSAVRVRTSNGQSGWASLTIMISRSSRTILATSVHARETGPDIAKIIARALGPPVLGPVEELSCQGELQRLNVLWPGLLNDAVHAAAAARRPAIRPSRILVDEEDRSHSAEAVCREFGVALVTSPPTLRAHAIVESAFLTISSQFVDKLPGQSRRHYRDNDEKGPYSA